MLITLSFLPNTLRFDATALRTSQAKPQTILTPVKDQCVIDPKWVSLGGLIDVGFRIAPRVTTTANRPTVNTYSGQMIFDSTLGTPIFPNAANSARVNAAGTVV